MRVEHRLEVGADGSAGVAGVILEGVALDAGQCPGTARPGPAAVGLRPESLTILFDGESTPGREVRGAATGQDAG